MKKTTLFIFITFLVIGNTSAQKAANLDNLPELKETWYSFKEAIKLADKNQLKFLCADSVIFSMVLGDMNLLSSASDEVIEDPIVNDNSMYKNYYYISFESFFQDELQFLFDNNMLTRMDDIRMLRVVQEGDNGSEYRFFITIEEPDDDFDGIEMALRFKKGNKGYLFWGVDTIQ